MQGIPVANVNAVPKVNAIDTIDALSSTISKKIFSSHTKSEEHSFAKLLARAQGKKIEAQVSDAFSGAGLSARGTAESLSLHGKNPSDRRAFGAARAGSARFSSAHNAKADMLSGANALHESKSAAVGFAREGASKPVRNEGVGAEKESIKGASKELAKKQTDDSASSDINEKKSLVHSKVESGERINDASDGALETVETRDAEDGARAALLQDFAYLVDGALDSDNADKGIDTKAESDTDDFFAESVSGFEDTVSHQTEAAFAHAAMTAETSGGANEDGGFSDEKTLLFETDDDTSALKRSSAFDTGGKIVVSDLRTEAAEAVSEAKPEAEKLIKIDAQGGDTSDVTMFMSENGLQHTAPSAQSAQAASSNFQAMLANQIRQNASEFIKAGSIVLRDNNEGTINLVLRPESLGNVKISLQLSDKVVSGQITVHSEEAYNAFKESADALKHAFAQSGFEAGGFTVAYSSAGTGGSFSGGGSEAGFAEAQNAAIYENAAASETPGAALGAYASGDHAVNVVA